MRRQIAVPVWGSDHGTKKPLGLPFAPYFHNRRFHSLTYDEVAQWFAQRVNGGAQDTKHRISKGARAFLRFAQQRGYTDLDLASVIDQFPAGEPRRGWLEWSEVHRLIAMILRRQAPRRLRPRPLRGR